MIDTFRSEKRVFFMGSSLPEGPFSEVCAGTQIA